MDGDTFGTFVGEFRTGEDCATGVQVLQTDWRQGFN